ncbi:MAG: ornithine carbamoyltransferase [Aestuariivita sp.]|nr:ornithine carbamoyltransferase [Aestuariivita sp.]MCY4202685.1 ornithine carbamoyltransferase [Aestuariivita sp.]MCY4287295.1 ornithine carbamoyltransferase [Aestuariivita sp.]MCY4346528.1 ornithine carbamoyltransferase [Aestuariivita sp.]
MPHFLEIFRTDANDLRRIIAAAKSMKSARLGLPKAALDQKRPLAGHMIALIFEKPSTRTRVSFDVGVRQLGGETIVLSRNDMQLGHGETIADSARVLSRYVDLIVLRTFEEAVIHEMAEYATVPVINGLTNRTHPCQVMADVMTFEEHRGSLADKKVVWVGDGTNVCASFLQASAKFDFKLTYCGPTELRPDDEFVNFAVAAGAAVTFERDIERAMDGADLVVTDTWISMHDSKDTSSEREALLRPYQVTEAVMRLAKADALFMHCLPAHRGEEVTSDVMDGSQSVIWDEAENRLHVQKAIMRWCLNQ